MTQQEKERKIKEVSAIIAKKYQPQKIILFGSHAWGKPNEDSDVDLFIVKETEDTREISRKISRFIFPRPFPMDIIVYKPEQAESRLKKGDFFIRDIFAKGKLLYESK